MCTGFVNKGNDIIFGFNLDIDPQVWDFELYKTDSYFTVGIRVGKTVYFTHGVNKHGHFSNVPYMNDDACMKRPAKNRERIDLLTDRYIRNKYSYSDVMTILDTKAIANVPGVSMHSLLADAEGHIVLIEPGCGHRYIDESYAVITNFPLMKEVCGDDPMFGKDRYARASEILSAADENFDAMDGMALLSEVKQEGQWATRISFVYSTNEKCVYYALDNRFDSIEMHRFS